MSWHEGLAVEWVVRMDLESNSLAGEHAADVKVYRLYGSRVGVAAESPFVTIMSDNPLMLNAAIADLEILRHQTRECRGFRIQLLATGRQV